jgi:hypothetical protein
MNLLLGLAAATEAAGKPFSETTDVFPSPIRPSPSVLPIAPRRRPGDVTQALPVPSDDDSASAATLVVRFIHLFCMEALILTFAHLFVHVLLFVLLALFFVRHF